VMSSFMVTVLRKRLPLPTGNSKLSKNGSIVPGSVPVDSGRFDLSTCEGAAPPQV